MYIIYGCGKSGISAAKLLERKKQDFVLYDTNEALDADEIGRKAGVITKEKIVVGNWNRELTKKIREMIISPGIPLDSAFVQEMKRDKIPVVGEIELAYRYMKGKLIAITGTNGKTTTTALTGALLNTVMPEVFVVGNIGKPFTDDTDKTTEESATVAEISSFQLETIETFHPQVSMILNITEDHLNRHHTMENYIRTKLRITENQTKDDICILNYEDVYLRKYQNEIPASIRWFSSERKLEQGYFYKEPYIYRAKDGKEEIICDVNRLHILGKHNYENAMAAIAAAEAFGVPDDKIREGLYRFLPEEHRFEYVATKRGVAYYNDSKGTNPDAAMKAIAAMKTKTLLIAGGYDKHAVYDKWIESFDNKVKYLVLIGQTREQIAEAAKRHGLKDEIVLCDTFEEAMRFCEQHAASGESVLLSPACASWGMFENFEQRGKMFKEYVYSIQE